MSPPDSGTEAADPDESPANEDSLSLSEADVSALNTEIESCQDRIVRVLVPTIISFGITSIGQVGVGASGALNYEILFGALFSVLFSSSLYITSMSYKIFERAAFLRVLTGDRTDWETVVHRYRKRYSPRIIGSETSTISLIYMVLSILFGAVFWGKMPTPVVVGATVVLFVIAFRIWLIPRQRFEERTARRVESVVESLED